MDMYFSCFGKKSTKRSRHRVALNCALPRTKAMLPYVPLPARTWVGAVGCFGFLEQKRNTDVILSEAAFSAAKSKNLPIIGAT